MGKSVTIITKIIKVSLERRGVKNIKYASDARGKIHVFSIYPRIMFAQYAVKSLDVRIRLRGESI